MSMSLKRKVRDLTADDVSQGVDITALKTTVGNSSSGLVKDVADIETAIGDESTEGTILARIKALEDAQTPTQEPNSEAQ